MQKLFKRVKTLRWEGQQRDRQTLVLCRGWWPWISAPSKPSKRSKKWPFSVPRKFWFFRTIHVKWPWWKIPLHNRKDSRDISMQRAPTPLYKLFPSVRPSWKGHRRVASERPSSGEWKGVRESRDKRVPQTLNTRLNFCLGRYFLGFFMTVGGSVVHEILVLFFAELLFSTEVIFRGAHIVLKF